MRITRLAPLGLLLLLAGRAAAQEPAHEPEPTPAPAPAPAPESGTFERPKLVQDSAPKYPPEAFEQQLEADVVVVLTVDEEGRVVEVELAEPAGHGFDEEALAAARKLRFSPARVDGVATAVKINYTFRFRLPEKETVAAPPPAACTTACPTDPRKPATLTITVYERGKGKLLPGVEVYLLDQDKVFLTDSLGRVEIELPPGGYAITVRPPDFYPFETIERLDAGEHLTVKYFIRRNRRARYKTIVWGTDGRSEVGRTSLADDEIRAVPGTLGDPIRVVMLLPGVTTSVSGLGYPIIRGSLPGDSLYEIDGIPVPMLYHLLLGNAVIHPRFIDEITFQPGGYAASSGRFMGGRISATTMKVEDDPLWVADLSLISTSLMRAQKVGPDSDFVLAARYGTLGYIVEGLNTNVVFRYWDYQARGTHRFDNGGLLSLTAIGVEDAAGDKDPDGNENVLHVGFQRLDLRYRQAVGRGWWKGGVQGGYEYFVPPEDAEDDDPVAADEWMARPYLEGGLALGKHVELSGGVDLLWQDFGLSSMQGLEPFVAHPDMGFTMGAWVSAELSYGGFVVAPSMRVDHYAYGTSDGSPRATGFDPRLSASYKISDDLTAKASAGVFHGPARLSFAEPPIVFGPIPAFNGLGLEYGLNRAWQFQTGVEAQLPLRLQGALTAYYHDTFAPLDFSVLNNDQLPNPGDIRNVDGRSFGVEAMVRRRLGEAFFGWLSYSWARSERTLTSVGTFPFDFDQTHVLNAVLSWDVGRNWTVGCVFHYNTGRPYTPFDIGPGGDKLYGPVNSARLPDYWRVDVRVQKREVFETWFFDFYIDLFNASFNWEVIGYEVGSDGESFYKQAEEVPLFIPMIGIRGEF